MFSDISEACVASIYRFSELVWLDAEVMAKPVQSPSRWRVHYTKTLEHFTTTWCRNPN